MGEIKSTLDLVMERTRHLSMSAEEKKAQQRMDFGKRLQGLLQQYADGVLHRDAMRNRIDDLQESLAVADREPVLDAIISRIDPDADDRRWIVLVEDLAPAVARPLETVLNAFHEQRADLAQKAMARRRETIAQNHGITGAAVIPNPAADERYRLQLANLLEKTQARMADLVRQQK